MTPGTRVRIVETIGNGLGGVLQEGRILYVMGIIDGDNMRPRHDGVLYSLHDPERDQVFSYIRREHFEVIDGG